MFPQSARSAILVSALSGFFGLALTGGSQAQSVRSQCSAKYQAAKTAGTLQGLSWNKFYSQCAAEAKAGDAAPSTVAPATTAAPAAPVAEAPAAPAPVATPATSKPARAAIEPATEPHTGDAVFPTAVSPNYSTLSAFHAREKTCGDQFKLNKTTGANGGLKWSPKGGGYWSECNKRLKAAQS